jgi:hypothetical protein
LVLFFKKELLPSCFFLETRSAIAGSRVAMVEAASLHHRLCGWRQAKTLTAREADLLAASDGGLLS